MNNQCKSCIHKDVCAYKNHYEDVEKLYQEARKEAGKYPWFQLEIRCVQYQHNVAVRKGIEHE